MFNMAGKIFEEKLTKLINESGLTISEAYYIVENASLRLKLLLNEAIFQEKINPTNFVEQKTTVSEIPTDMEKVVTQEEYEDMIKKNMEASE